MNSTIRWVGFGKRFAQTVERKWRAIQSPLQISLHFSFHEARKICAMQERVRAAIAQHVPLFPKETTFLRVGMLIAYVNLQLPATRGVGREINVK
jgi:hypothetical protein